jgi:hypothetical protein
VNFLTSNPEFLRYVRSQLRPTKLLAVTIICLVISVTTVFSLFYSPSHFHQNTIELGTHLLATAFYVQGLILAIGGGLACLLAISSEKDQNTFDFQRMTALTPLELTLGKLFGAPILMYYVCLCFAPFTILVAFIAHANPVRIVAAYVALFVASLAFHALNLLLSLLAVKGTTLSGLLLSLVVLLFASINSSTGSFRLYPLGPFESADLAIDHGWPVFYPPIDLFFGRSIHHFPVLVIVDLAFTSFFLLAVVRNIKKDPEFYEVYSPLQSLSFLLFLNVIFAGFYALPDWPDRSTVDDDLSMFLFFNMILFVLLGLALVRSRSRMRNLLRSSSSAWKSFLWPAPVLIVGAVLVSGLLLVDLNFAYRTPSDWHLPSAAVRCLIFTFWIIGTAQFLQFMNLGRGKHPVLMAILYLIIYYICATFILIALGGNFGPNGKFPITALFVPVGIFAFSQRTWHTAPTIWVSAIALQIAFIALLFVLQSRLLRRLSHS